MKKILCLLTLGALFSVSVYAADEAPQADVFLGYSFLRANSARDIPAFTANGGAGTFGYNFNNNLGLEAEFGGYHNGNIHNVHLDTTMATFLFGPRFSWGRSKTFDPYVHFLFGGAHVSTSIAGNSVLIPVHPIAGGPTIPAPGSDGRYAASQANFAMAIGGGIDIKLSKGVYLRAMQIDYFLTRFQDLGLPTALFGEASKNRNQNNLRFATGIGFNFGGAH